MSNEQKRPKVGDVVWCRGVIIKTENPDATAYSFKVEWAPHCWDLLPPSAIIHIGDPPPAPERKPWETLREAAEIMDDNEYDGTANLLRNTAKHLESDAASPDPVALLRDMLVKYDAGEITTKIMTTDWAIKARASIKAHDTKADKP